MDSRKIINKKFAVVALGAAILCAGPAVVGCSGDAASVSAAADEVDGIGIRQVRKDVNLSLPAAAAGTRYELELGTSNYPVEEHSAASSLRAGGATHFVMRASFSKEAPQSYRLVHVDAKGNRSLVLAGIHVPGTGDDKGDVDPLQIGFEDAAQYIVFHDPSLMTIDKDAAAKVMAHIRSAPSFKRLVASVTAYGQATSMADQKEGYQGWAVTIPALDSKGNPILRPVGKAKVMTPATSYVIAGSPAFKKAGFQEVKDENGDTVETPFDVAQLVKKEARLAVRDDASLLDIMYTQNQDATVRANEAAMPQGGKGNLAFTLDDTQWKGDRRISIVKQEGRKVTFKIENNQWRRFGVLVRFRKPDGTLIAKADMKEKPESEPACKWFNDGTKYSTLLEIVDGRFTVLGVPLTAETVKQFTVEMPEEASSMEVNIASAGLRHVEKPSYVGTEEEPNMLLPGQIHTMLMDVALPAMALTIGAAATTFTATRGGRELVKDLAAFGVELGAKVIMAAITSGKSGASAFTREFATEILAEVVVKHAKIAQDLVEWVAETGAEKALEGAMGAIGAIMEAVEVIGTVAGIAETLGTIANNAPIVYDRIQASQTVKVRILPKGTKEMPGMFSRQATKAEAFIYYGHSTVPTVVSAPIDWSENDNQGPKEIVISVPKQPVGGEIKVKVKLENDTHWTAAEGKNKGENKPTEGNTLEMDVEVDNNPTPINEKTHYEHDRVLVFNKDKQEREWMLTKQAPTLAGPQVCNTADASRPYVCGASSMTINEAGILGYAWTGSGKYFTTCDGQSMTRGSTAATLNLNPAFGKADDLRKELACGRSAPVFISFDPTGTPAEGNHVMVVPNRKTGEYMVYGIDISKKGSLEPVNDLVLGTFRAKQLDVIVSNPATGMLLGLDKANRVVEALKLAPQAMPVNEAPQGIAIGGEGTSIGRLTDPQNIAFLPAGAGFVVLEGSGRVQAFTFDGASAPLFAGKAAFPLNQASGEKVTYTDLKVDPSNDYVYVTSYVGDAPKPGDYRLDIYRFVDGTFVSRTTGVVAQKIAINRWRDLYTLNYANLEGSVFPEPSVSEYIAPVIEH